MKVALCLSGQPRMFKTSYASLKTHILDNYNCDIFIDTWKFKNTDENFYLSHRYKDEGSLEELYDTYQPRVLNVEKFDEIFEFKCLDFESRIASRQGAKEDNYLRRYYSMLYKIYNCNKIKNEYEKKMNIHYDIVVRSRLDVLYTQKIEFNKDINLTADRQGSGRDGCAGDILAYGVKDTMDIYCDLFNQIYHYFSNGVFINTEIVLPHHLDQTIKSYSVLNNKIFITRPSEDWQQKYRPK